MAGDIGRLQLVATLQVVTLTNHGSPRLSFSLLVFLAASPLLSQGHLVLQNHYSRDLCNENVAQDVSRSQEVDTIDLS
ncbi:uncharacterized protein RSE6_03261 [Rhynchosporium secalis]|uniref:Uncharacterized protein n=1 Tax=Rhynchosporium secalis TaxID=38038 RepID=A0A1E1M2B6_RHYSE|nr:uncharacterized protein RSE6_03261 [Rhynchosporium secalis]